MSKIEYLVIPRTELEDILETLEDASREISWFKEDGDILQQHMYEAIEYIVRRLNQVSVPVEN